MLAWTLGVVHGLAFIAAIMNPLAWWVKMLLATATVGSLCLSLRHYIFQPMVCAILRKPHGEWGLVLKDGSMVKASLQSTTLVTIWFTLLHLQTESGTLGLLLCRDSLDNEAYRLLRVLLKIDAVTSRS